MSENHKRHASQVEVTDPGGEVVYRYLMYGLSLPERTVRSTAAMLGGAINESASLLVPTAFRDSKTYNTFVKQMLDVVSNDVGGVQKDEPERPEGVAELEVSTSSPVESPQSKDGSTEDGIAVDPQDPEVENYVARKAVSTFVDLAGMATLHVSPLTVLAIISDVAYGTKTYLNELADELKREGVIAEDSTIASTADLLDAIGEATSGTVDALDTPPLSVDGLRETIQKTTESVGNIDPTKLIPQAEIAKMWSDMQEIAEREDVSVFEVSSAVTMYALEQVNTVTKGALTTIRVTGELIDRHLFEHYWAGLEQISEKGIYEMVSESSRPYIDSVWFNFSSTRPTITEDVVSGRLIWRVWNWITGRSKKS